MRHERAKSVAFLMLLVLRLPLSDPGIGRTF
jgi:hypothetical protein